SVALATDALSKRLHLPPDAQRPDPGRPARRRFVKVHLPVEEFDGTCIAGVWLVVRDPRDALYSWYRYHVGFAERDWERVAGTFEEFLAQPFFTDKEPVAGWASFYRGWLDRAGRERSAVVRFEDLKLDPVQAMQNALGAVGLEIDAEEIERAARPSSFAA